jgi:AcrR family transcriptional regulator
MSRSSYHHGDLREELLRRALVKIETDGLAALSLRDLARESGVSPAAPQRHFPTKEDLLTAMAVRGYTELGQIVEDLKLAGPVEKALTKFARAYVAYVVEHPALVQLMYSRLFDTRAAAVNEASHQAFTPVDRLLDSAREDGSLVDDPQRVAVYVRVVMRGLATSFSTGALGPKDQSMVPRVVESLLSGLRPR